MNPANWSATTWVAISAVVTASATLALAFFGAVTIWREKKRERERTRAADALVQRSAYPLRRQLISWIRGNEPWPREDLGRRDLARYLTRHFETAEERVEGMLEAAAGASEATARAAREASEEFWRATGFLNEAAAASHKGTRTNQFGELVGMDFKDNRIAEQMELVPEILAEAVRRLTVAMGRPPVEAERLLAAADDR